MKIGKKVKGVYSWLSPLEWLGKGVAFMFTTKKLYLSWFFALVPALLLLMFSAYVGYEYPDFFFTNLLLEPVDLPEVVSVYYISFIVGLVLVIVTLFGRLASHFSNKIVKAEKELNSTMKELAESYPKLNNLTRELNDLKGL